MVWVPLSLSGKMMILPEIYCLLTGKTTLGYGDKDTPQDIVIQGVGVDKEHCYITHEGGVVTLHPVSVLCSVDGVRTSRPIKLTQGKLHFVFNCTHFDHTYLMH